MVTETLPHPTQIARDTLRRAAPRDRRRPIDRLEECLILAAAFAGGLLLQIALILALGLVIE